MQVWRAHRAQFFSWQQKRAEGENGVVDVNPGRAKKLQDHIQALRVQYEVRILLFKLSLLMSGKSKDIFTDFRRLSIPASTQC